jgi:hypothetical protein
VVSGGRQVCFSRSCLDDIRCRPQPVTGYCATLSSTNTSLSCVSPLGQHHGVYLLKCTRIHGRFVTALSLEYTTVLSSLSFLALPSLLILLTTFLLSVLPYSRLPLQLSPPLPLPPSTLPLYLSLPISFPNFHVTRVAHSLQYKSVIITSK